MRAKLGLAGAGDGDAALIQDLLDVMKRAGVDYTAFFRGLCDGVLPPGFAAWGAAWHTRLQGAPPAAMRAANPAFIPRNHQVEAVLAAAAGGDFAPFHTLLGVLKRPYEDQPDFAHLAEPPLPGDTAYRTFCGT